MGGSKKSEQLQRLAEEPGRLVANSRFLGRVEVPLSETLSLKRGQHPPHSSLGPQVNSRAMTGDGQQKGVG